jgi:hypothetical protein
MKKEHTLSNEIRLWCGKRDLLCHHINVGKIRLPDGSYFRTGVPKGWPDLQIIGYGWIAYIETKIWPNKPSKEQKEMIAELNRRRIPATVCYSMSQFVDFIERKLNHEYLR